MSFYGFVPRKVICDNKIMWGLPGSIYSAFYLGTNPVQDNFSMIT